MNKYALILVWSLFIYSCTDSCDQDFFQFRLQPKIISESPTIKAGERVNVLLNYPDTLVSFFDTVTYNLRAYDIVTTFAIGRLDSVDQNLNVIGSTKSDFEVVLKSGVESDFGFSDTTYYNFNAAAVNMTENKLEFDIIPQKSGLYYGLFIHGNASVYEDEIISDGCEEVILTTYENVGNSNLQLFLNLDTLNADTASISELVGTRGLFFFEVIP